MPLQLRIELKSPLCAGSGIGRPGGVDREISFDADGLPFIPGRTLKGLLRDAYAQLMDSPYFSGLPETEVLFGRGGEMTSGPVEIGSAELQNSAVWKPWLKGVFAYYQRAINRVAVMNYFSEVRRQTAIDFNTGAPDENTLRATRTLRTGPDMVFLVSVGGLTGDRNRDALALAAAALQHMGTARTRGFGWVKVTLCEGAMDLTASALAALEKNEATFKGERECYRSRGPVTIPAGNPAITPSQPPSHVLRFRVELQQPLLITNPDGDANLVASQQNIPGSTIRGLLAQRWIERGKNLDQFYRLFCSGSVSFLSANPEAGGDQVRATPIPHSIRQSKEGDGNFQDYANENPLRDFKPRRYTGWTPLQAVMAATSAEKVDPEFHYSFHHERAKDPRIGRAVGELADEYGLTNAEGGAVFTYQSLDSGQCFQGAILGADADLKELRDLIDGQRCLRLGRSRSAQYGGMAKWTWIDGPTPIAEKGGESAGWKGDEPEAPEKCVRVTLLSPMICRNKHGHSTAEFPASELALRLLGNENGLKLVSSYTRTIRVGGYLSHQGLPRQQETALAAGSVFVFKLDKPPYPGCLQKSRDWSYGLRTEDGFGRISIDVRDSEVTHIREKEIPPPSRPQVLNRGDACYDLALGILEKQLEEEAVTKGIQDANGADISNSLLHRLIHLVERNSLPELKSAIDVFAEPARARLKACPSIHKTLTECIENLGAQFEAVKTAVDNRDWTTIIDAVFSEEREQEIVKKYLSSYLRAVAWHNREAERVAKDPNGQDQN